MKLVLCGSTRFFDEMISIQKELEALGHTVYHPERAELKVNTITSPREKRLQYIRIHLNKIKDSDAILVVNNTKDSQKNYIGGNTFLEMGFAFAFEKKIYILNQIPDTTYTDEITGLNPIILNGNLKAIGN